MKARVRSPGSRASETASAAVAARVAVGVQQPAEGDVERHLAVVELDPERGRRARRTGVPTRSGWRSTSRRGSSPRARSAGAGGIGARRAGSGGRSRGRRPASSSSARSSSSAAHSSSKNRSLVSISVARSCIAWRRAPRVGVGCVGGESERGVRRGPADQLVDRLELAHRRDRALSASSSAIFPA